MSKIVTHGLIEPSSEEDAIKMGKVQCENTYSMEPESRFPPGKVEAIMREVLKENLEDKTYDPSGCSTLAKWMTQEIKAQVRDLDLKRFKIVCVVLISEQTGQSIRIGSRCLWDTSKDNFAHVAYTTQHLFATAMTYALYYE